MSAHLNYQYEQRGRRPTVALAVVLGAGMIALGVVYGAPWYWTTVVAIPTLMALVMFVRDSRSGLALKGDTLTLFADGWRHEIDVRTIRRVRLTVWANSQPSLWLELDGAPPYRVPSYCFGAATPITDALRQRGVPVE